MSARGRTRNDDVAALAGDAALVSAVTVVVGPLALAIGPLVSWLLHGRRITKGAVIGWIVGLGAGNVVAGAIFGLVVLADRIVGGSDQTAPISGIVALAIGAVIALIALFALDFGAIRDLSSGRRANVRLDVTRLVFSALLVAGVVASVMLQRANPGSEYGEAGIFAMGSGVIAAVAMCVASMIAARIDEPATPRPLAGDA